MLTEVYSVNMALNGATRVFISSRVVGASGSTVCDTKDAVAFELALELAMYAR